MVQLMQKFVPRNRIGIFGNERARSTPLDPKLKYWFFFVLFGYILDLFCYCTKLGAKRIELVQLMKNSCHEIASEFFAMNAPDPPHWTLNSSIGSFHTIWVHCGFVSLLHETRCKTGWIGAINEEVCATKSHQSFLQWTHPIDPIGC